MKHSLSPEKIIALHY